MVLELFLPYQVCLWIFSPINSLQYVIQIVAVVVSRRDSVGVVCSPATHEPDHSLSCSVAQYGVEFLVNSLMNQTASQQGNGPL